MASSFLHTFQVKRQGGRGVSRRRAPDHGEPAEQPVEEIHLQGRRGARSRHEWSHQATTGAPPAPPTRVVLSPIGEIRIRY